MRLAKKCVSWNRPFPGNEPASKAYCKVTPHEEATIIEAILQQKVGANAKNFKQYAEYKQYVEMHLDSEQWLACLRKGGVISSAACSQA